MSNVCPECGSSNTRYSERASLTFCKDCDFEWPLTKSPESAPEKRLNIFISYPHQPIEHTQLAMQMVELFRRRGHDVWFDADEIKVGSEWRDKITEGVLKSDWVIAFLSKHSVRDPGVCLNEIGIALNHRAGDSILRTILIENEKDVNAPVSVTHIQWVDMHDFINHLPGAATNPLQKENWQQWLDGHFGKLLASIESDKSPSGEIDELRRRLQPSFFGSDIASKTIGFAGRQWLLDQIENWRKTKPEARTLWLKGAAGMGKSAIACQLAHSAKSKVLGIHLCKWDETETHDANRYVKTMAFQLATRLSDYRRLLLNRLRNEFDDSVRLQNAKGNTLFRELILNLLSDKVAINAGQERYYLILDALDEAISSSGRNELLDLVANDFEKLPSWLGVIVTSRPEQHILVRLKNPIEIDTSSSQNQDDIRQLLDSGFKPYLPDDCQRKDAVEIAVQRSGGVILYAVELLKGVKSGGIQASSPSTFPEGLENIFLVNMERLCPDIGAYRLTARPLLELIAKSPYPLPDWFAQQVLGWSAGQMSDALNSISSLLIQHGKGKNTTMQFFHKSFAEWLLNPKVRHQYVLEGDGGSAIAKFLWPKWVSLDDLNETNEEKRKSNWAPFLTDWLPCLISETDVWNKQDDLFEFIINGNALFGAPFRRYWPLMLSRLADLARSEFGEHSIEYFRRVNTLTTSFRQAFAFGQGISLLENALKNNADLPQDQTDLARVKLAEMYALLGEYDSANNALPAQSTVFSVADILCRGQISLGLENYGQAESIMRNALEQVKSMLLSGDALDSDVAKLHLVLAFSLLGQKRGDEALIEANNAITNLGERPCLNLARALFCKAQVLGAQGLPEDAEILFLGGLNMIDQNPHFHFERAEILVKLAELQLRAKNEQAAKASLLAARVLLDEMGIDQDLALYKSVLLKLATIDSINMAVAS